MTHRLIPTVAILLALPVLAMAQGAREPVKISEFRDWTAYSYSDDRGKICYAASQPKETEPRNVNRDPIFFMISTRPADSVRNEASVIIGYPIKADSKVAAIVDGETFTLFSDGDGAWVENPAEESALIAAMQKGRSLIVKGTSRRGTNTTDTYSLQGVTAALAAVAEECPAP